MTEARSETTQQEPLDPSVGELFKAYDIRGTVPDQLNPDIAYRIGRAIVAFLDVPTVCVGRDMRVSGPVLSQALISGIRDQGADVVDIGLVSTDGLYFDLDGTFPNHEANPIEPENVKDLERTVVEQHCDLGVAFDGDADRMFLIDEKGEFVGGDMTTAMVAIEMLQRDPGAAIVYNLICSRSVPEVITEHGGRPIRSRVGHSFIKATMRQEDAIFGGEHSGHFYFRANWYADSGLIAMLTVLQLISKAGKPLSEVLKPIDRRVRSGEINSEVDEPAATIANVERVYKEQGAEIDHLDGLTVNFPGWWFNLRASNTQPLLRLNVEADDRKTLEEKTKAVLALVRGT